MLKIGLNIKKKTQPQPPQASRPAPLAAFDQGDSDDEASANIPRPFTGGTYQNAADVEEFSEVYDYDGVYDSMKSGDKEAAKAKEIDKRERKPKYMQNLFEMADTRKRDRLRAQDVKLQREREAEGDDFADKEKFVTKEYRAQQEELRRIEAEELEREIQIRAQGGGFGAFKQSILENDLKKHEAAVQASMNAKRTTEPTTEELSVSTDLIHEVQKAESILGHKIALNDDNQIVDHRQLLGAGLNKPARSAEHLQTSNLSSKPVPVRSQVNLGERRQQLERQQRQIDQQLRDMRKREADEELAREAAIKEQSKRKTDGEVSSARERYLARKKAEAEAKSATLATAG